MSEKKEKVGYFMDKIFPEFVRAFFGALLLVLGAWIARSSTSKTPTTDLPFSFGINKDLALLIYFIVFLYAIKLLWSSLKTLIVSFYDSKQLKYGDFDEDDPDLYGNTVTSISTDGVFLYQITKGKNAYYQNIPPVGLTDISNPKCGKDNCLTELVYTKTYFGRYKYRCPFCNNKVKSDYDVSTLREQARLIERKELLVSDIEKEKAKKNAEIEAKAQEFLDMINDLEKKYDALDKKTEGFFDDPSSPDLPRNEKELREFEDNDK